MSTNYLDVVKNSKGQRPTIDEASRVVKFLRRFILFNGDVEIKHWRRGVNKKIKYGSGININKVLRLALMDLCLPDKPFLDKLKHPLKCKKNHKKSSLEHQWCGNVQYILNLAIRLNQLLAEHPNFRALKPKFSLIGSLIERTRIGAADESDINLMFGGLNKDCFLALENAFDLKLSEKGKTIF